jgi:leader peptidase (prepilin peptidase)/N-methyltransferase
MAEDAELSKCPERRSLVPDWLTAAIVAPFAGSLAGLLAHRLPREEPVVVARSACETCHTPLGVADLVPLLSYAALRGRCRHCGAPIGWRHPAMEIGALLIALWAATVFSGFTLWASCALGWPLLALAACDLETYLLPDALTLPLLLAGLAVTWRLTPDALSDHALAAAAGYLAFLGIAKGYRYLRGRDGLGMGDAKLLAAAGAWLGLASLPNVVLIAAVSGLLAAGGAALRGQRLSAQFRLPFGPALAFAIWLSWLYF